MLASKFLQQVAPVALLTPKELKLLQTPERILQDKIKVNGKTYSAYRVQYNSARGPYKGGIRFHPQVTLDEVQSLSF